MSYMQHSRDSMMWGAAGVILYLGPLALLIYRKRDGSFESNDYGYFLASFILGPALLVYGAIVYGLEILRSTI